MKYLLYFLICVIILSAVIYVIPPLHVQAVKLLTYNACDTPLSYNIGSIDPRFGYSNQEVLQDVQEATGIWSDAYGKNLFTYAPQAAVTVNFEYDQRQALDTSINQLHSQISQNKQSLKEQIAQYESDLAAFKQELADFNATVKKYNQEGGAPPDVYNQLIKQQQQLNADGDALNARAKELNLSTTNYNASVSQLNSDISEFNNVLNQKPEEGLYNGEKNTITIYFADNKKELIHTLTHEFGHALGMDHVKDQHAIMYPYTTGSLQITADDLQQLHYVCRNQSLVVHDLQLFDFWLYNEAQNIRSIFGVEK